MSAPSLEERHCALCGPGAGKRVKFPATFGESDLNAAVFSARRLPDRVHFRLVECARCGMVFSDPACDATTLSGLYQKSEVNYRHQEDQIYDAYAPVLDRALPWLSRRGTFVEIGGGSGFMLRHGVERGFEEQIEVEPSADAEAKFVAPSPRARFVRSVLTDETLSPASASLICFFQMLDHVPAPDRFLQAVERTLEPGGVAVCVTHNTQALSARLLGERSPIFDIEHTYLFHPENLTSLFRKLGFGRVEAFPISNPYSLGSWLRLAPLPPRWRTSAARALEVSGLAGVRVPLRAGNFAVIARKG